MTRNKWLASIFALLLVGGLGWSNLALAQGRGWGPGGGRGGCPGWKAGQGRGGGRGYGIRAQQCVSYGFGAGMQCQPRQRHRRRVQQYGRLSSSAPSQPNASPQ